jgi:hypothetical protein
MHPETARHGPMIRCVRRLLFDDGKRYVVHADERLTAFLELERITHELAVSALLGDDNH